jgi:hypothetical protein
MILTVNMGQYVGLSPRGMNAAHGRRDHLRARGRQTIQQHLNIGVKRCAHKQAGLKGSACDDQRVILRSKAVVTPRP